MNLDHGGHLTHGSPVNFSGKLYKIVHYGVAPGQRDDRLRRARGSSRSEHRPKMIVAGAVRLLAHHRLRRFRAIADEVGALLFADIAHIAGLVAAGLHPSPVPHRRFRHHHHAQDAARPARRA